MLRMFIYNYFKLRYFGGTLADLLKKHKLHENHCKYILFQLCRATKVHIYMYYYCYYLKKQQSIHPR